MLLYIHIPYCRQKCRYCDFASYAGQEGTMPAYVDALLREADAKDELDLMAFGQGCKSLMDMVVKSLGFKDATDVNVVVEGSMMAAQVYAANEAAKAPVNKLTPQPFIYIPTKTVTPSVTAEPVKEVPQYNN